MRISAPLAAGLVLLLAVVGIVMAQGGSGHWTLRSTSRPVAARLPDLVRYVNPLIGTIHDGNVFPGATMPWGMVQWSPDTSAGGLTMPGGYNAGDLIIRGFSLTHLSGAGCAAFGNVPFMPTTQPVVSPPLPNGSPYSARFTHAEEHAAPGAYAVRLATGIAVRLTVTERTGFGAFVFPAVHAGSILINPGSSAGAHSNSDGAQDAGIQIVGNDLATGFATSGRFCGLHNRYTVYFAERFNRPFTRYGTWGSAGVHAGARLARGSSAGGYLTFDTAHQRTVLVHVGLSYVSTAGALANLRTEERSWNFAAAQQHAETRWNRLLNAIQVGGGTFARRQVFYTALYHALLQPTVFSDADDRYRGFDGHIHRAAGYTQYANFSGWDIYRTVIPLLGLLFPRQTGDMMQSLVADAQQGGWLPKWPVANVETGEMNGDSADPIFAEALAFGARHFDTRAALAYMIKGATTVTRNAAVYQERPGLDMYLRNGYLYQLAYAYGAVSTTLEYTLDDFAIAQAARSLGNRSVYRTFLRRSHNWRSVFNPATGFMEQRQSNGAFAPVFNPASMDGFVEGNAWQYTWMVPQDMAGLIHAMGGGDAVVRKLDAFFTRLNAGPLSSYAWMGNEPTLGVPWVYDFAGRPWRTQATIHRISRTLFTDTTGGLPGNDDLGTMSSWYVWAAIGLYPAIPGVAGWAISSPLFPHLVLHLGSHRLDITARRAPNALYVRSMTLDGRAYNRAWLPYSAVRHGGAVRFELGNTPNRRWASAPRAAPPSF